MFEQELFCILYTYKCSQSLAFDSLLWTLTERSYLMRPDLIITASLELIYQAASDTMTEPDPKMLQELTQSVWRAPVLGFCWWTHFKMKTWVLQWEKHLIFCSYFTSNKTCFCAQMRRTSEEQIRTEKRDEVRSVTKKLWSLRRGLKIFDMWWLLWRKQIQTHRQVLF